MEIERLAAALGLPLERMLDELLVVLPHVRPDRTTPLGRGLDHRDVAETGERHVQRARNRRRAQRKHVDLQAELAQQLLLRDAEALFLVDDDEAEIRRDDVAREDAVGADEDVHLARREVGERALHVGRAAEPRHHLAHDREIGVALSERVPVLLREDRRGRQHERLPPVERDRERRPHGDLRLAEPDVAADEPVHGPRGLEILLHGLDRLELIRRLAERERRLEPLEPVVREVEGNAGGVLALRVQRQQLPGQLAAAWPARLLTSCHARPPSFESVGCRPSAPT